jgi:hypothetical protein
MEKTYIDSEVGPVVLRKNRRSRRITLRVNQRGVTVTLPILAPYRMGVKVFLEKKAWVMEVQERQKARMNDEPVPSQEEIEAMRAEAKRVLPSRLEELAEKYSFKYNQVRIKHNVSNWGSCSRKGNINLNLNLVRLPEELRDYVMLHELCHLKHPDHGKGFHALLESLCPDHRRKEKELRKFRIF